MAEHRAKKSGLGAEIDKKQEAKYDEVEAAGTTNAVMIWLNAVVGGDHELISSHNQKELHRALRDGVMLCKIVNKLLEKEGKSPVKFNKKATSTFVAMGNSEAFCKGCTDYGMDKESLFQSTDLWEGRKGPFLNVINCIHSLGFQANKLGYPVTYTGKEEKFLDNE